MCVETGILVKTEREREREKERERERETREKSTINVVKTSF